MDKCRTVLSSGRVVEFTEVTTEDYLTIQQRIATKIGNRKDPNGTLAKTLSAVELVATCTVRVSKNNLPFVFKSSTQQNTEESEDIASAFLPKQTKREVDTDAMCTDEYVNQHGGWTDVTYQDLMSEKHPNGIKKLFSKLTDFNSLAAAIIPEEDEGVLLGKARVRISG